MIHFFEMSGPDAYRTLRILAAACIRAGNHTELLVSDDRPELYLLLCRGAGPDESPAAGVRHWTFRPLDEEPVP